MKFSKASKLLAILLATVLFVPSGWLVSSVVAETGQRTIIYQESFISGAGAATQSGSASLTPVTNKVFDGNSDGAALYVSNRSIDWDAVDLPFSSIGVTDGNTYQVSVTLYVDEDVVVPAGAQAFLQTVDSYGRLGQKAYVAGEAITLTGNLIVDTSKDRALRILSNDDGETVPFYIGEITITGEAESTEPEPSRPPALPFTTIDFENDKLGGFVGRSGTEKLTITDEENHTENGSYALKVEGRTDTWHGPSLRVEQYVDKGYEYTISAWVKLISPASSQLQLSTQVGNGNGANYVALSPKTISTNDGWVQFTGSYRYNNVSSEYLTIYIESSNNETASFYIDDISFTRTGSGPIQIQDDLAPIKSIYESDFLIGSAISSEDLDGVRLDLLNMHHNVVTTGNAMKPDALQPTKGNFTFTAADSLVNTSLDEGLEVHGHVLVWHSQSPAWMNTGKDLSNNTVPLSRDEALTNLKTHIRTVMEHFGDRVISWDVVNEAMNDNPSNPSNWEGALRQSDWYKAIGPDFVEQAFLAAREVLNENPTWDIKLYYNDYNEDNQNKAEAIYSMVKEINENYAEDHPGKLLIDGVGMQGHYNINTNPNNVRLSLEKFISLGVEVSITELDIQAGSNYELSEKLASEQGYLYAQLFELFKEHSANIARVTFWGLDDNTSWRAANNPLLFDKNLQAKPAYYAVIDPTDYIANHAPVVIEANQAVASYGTPTIDGTIDPIWSKAEEMQVNRYQTAWQGATGIAKALWDENYLYVLVQVSDDQLDKSNVIAWEQDSVEIFLDQNNGKTTFYEADDGQYRINFDNETSFSSQSIANGFQSATSINGTNYVVEVKIPLTAITAGVDTKLGFDVQINDAKNGIRQSVAAWNDTTGTGYMDTSVYGELTLKSDNVPEPTTPPNPTSSSGNSGAESSSPNTINVQVTNQNNRTLAAVTSNEIQTALGQLEASAQRQVIIQVPNQSSTTTYEIQLPVQSNESQEPYTLLINTEYGTVTIPSKALNQANSNATSLSLLLSNTDASLQANGSTYPILNVQLSQQVSGVPLTISIPYSPSEAEVLNSHALVVMVKDKHGNLSPLTNSRFDESTQSLLFETDVIGTFVVAYVQANFTDLSHAPWAKEAIETLFARNLIDGTTATQYSPQASITRADFITLMMNMLQLTSDSSLQSPFVDLNQADSHYAAIVSASQLGIINGFEDKTFRPDVSISRQEMMVVIYRALTAAGHSLPNSSVATNLSDESSIANYAKLNIQALVAAGIINGKNGKLAPADASTRAEVAVILYRILTLINN